MLLVAALMMGQLTSMKVCDPNLNSKCATTTDAGSGKVLLDVNVILPVPVTGGPLNVQVVDAGPPLNVNPHGVTVLGGIVNVQIVDAGSPLNVQGPLTDTQLRASAVPVSQSGTWTVQPGNTANTTPWLTTDTPRTVSSANNSGTCVSVGTSSTTVLASNASRRAYGFKASEANTDRVYCKLGATATTSNMPFGAGSAWSQDTGAVYTGVVDCIAGSGTQTVCPYEFN